MLLLLLWPLLTLWVAGASRRRAHAATIVPEPATEPAVTAAHAPASSSSAVSSNEAPLEVIRLEDGTVLVERRGNFVGPPPPTPVNQPVASDITEETVCEPTAYGGYDLQDVECQDMVPASSSSATAPPVHRLSTAPARLEALPLDMQETMNKMVRSWAAIATLTVSVDEEGPHGWQSQGWEVDPRPLARQDLLNLADLMYLVRQQLRDNLPPRLLEVAMDRLRQLVRAPTPGLSPLAEELLDPPTPPVPGPNPYLTLFQQSDSASDSLEEVQIDEADEAATLLAITPDHTAAAASDFPSESSSEEEEVHMESEASQLRTLANADCRMIAAAEGYADRLRAARVARTASTPAGSGGRELPAPEHGLSAAALRERARAMRRRLGVHPRLLHPMLSQHSECLRPLQERLTPPELEGHASLSKVTASMLRAADIRPLASKPSCPSYAVITHTQHAETEGSTSLTVARHSRPQLSQRLADLSNVLHGLLRATPLRRVPFDTAPASRVPACLRDRIPMLNLDLGVPLVEQARAPSPVSGGLNAPGARRCGTFLRCPVHTSVTAGARGKTSCGAHVCLCTCRQYAQVPGLTCSILPQLTFEQLAYARCVLQKPCVTRVSCQCAAMPIPGTPVGGERATGSIGTAPQRSTSVEDNDEDFRDPEATLLDPIVLPKRRWGHYAKWAMRHTDRLVPLPDKPTRAATTIPGPTKAKGVVDAKIGPRGRAVAKMAAKAGLRCLVCHAVTHTCDHTRVEINSSDGKTSVELVHCHPSLYCLIGPRSSCHCRNPYHSSAAVAYTSAQVRIGLQALCASHELSSSICPALPAACTWLEQAQPQAEGVSSLIAHGHVDTFAREWASQCGRKIQRTQILYQQPAPCSRPVQARWRCHATKPGLLSMSRTACAMLKYTTRWALLTALVLPCVMPETDLRGPWTPTHERECAASIPLDRNSGRPDMYTSEYPADTMAYPCCPRPSQRQHSQRSFYSTQLGPDAIQCTEPGHDCGNLQTCAVTASMAQVPMRSVSFAQVTYCHSLRTLRYARLTGSLST